MTPLLSRISKLRIALEAIEGEAQQSLGGRSEYDPTTHLEDIAGTARLALSFDDADALHSK